MNDSELIWLDNEPEELRTLTHYAYTEEGVGYLNRSGGSLRRVGEAMGGRVFPGIQNGTDVYLFGTPGCVTTGMSVNASRNGVLRRQHSGIDTSNLISRGTSVSRVREVDIALAPWSKPTFDPSTATPKQLRKALRRAQKAHRRDVRIIGREFLTEANQRGLCEEYDTVVRRVNAALTVKMPSRQRFVVQAEVTARQEVPVTVASDATDAEIIAAALAIRSDLSNARVVR